jgi:hypothetical protein
MKIILNKSKKKIGYLKSNKNDGVQEFSEPKIMTKIDLLNVVSNWYDCQGTSLNSFDMIQIFIERN